MSDVRRIPGDCREVIKTIADDSVDSCVTDPPYSLVSIVNRFGKTKIGDGTQTSKRSRNRSDGYARLATGFMGKAWDTGEVAHDPAWWAEVYRVLKPGAHLVAFGGTRTYHRMVCAIEDAGFEIRDSILDMVSSDAAAQAFYGALNDDQRATFFRCIEESGFGGMLAWCFGTGFPKSHSVSKAIDRATPATDAAREWDGFGTALKPAFEPICLARKPLSEPTIASNVLRWGTGALNIDGCRIGDIVETWPASRSYRSYAPGQIQPGGIGKTQATGNAPPGRWPANAVHDGSDEVLAAFPDSAGQLYITPDSVRTKGSIYSGIKLNREFAPRGDSGSAARFFYSAKADKDDRWGSKHPTVKPIDLIRWLQRLVTPPGGLVLDPFAGSGTSGVAALGEGFDAILIEREAEYVADIEARLAYYRGEGRHWLTEKAIREADDPSTLTFGLLGDLLK